MRILTDVWLMATLHGLTTLHVGSTWPFLWSARHRDSQGGRLEGDGRPVTCVVRRVSGRPRIEVAM